VNQSQERDIQDMAIIGRKVYLHLSSRQWICDSCGRHFYERFSFVEPHGTMTQRYEKFIYYRCIGADLQYIVVQEDHCWQTVNRIFQKWSKRALSSVNLFDGVRALGIDEIALYKGRGNYVCVLVNLETGQILDLLEDRTKAYLITYFSNLGETFCQGIEVFSCDLWDGYTGAAVACFPKAEIVLDRFHFFGQLQQALDKTRKAFRKEFPKEQQVKSLKWMLLKPAERLSEKQRQTLESLFEQEQFLLLKQAYLVSGRKTPIRLSYSNLVMGLG
jgi:transposase